MASEKKEKSFEEMLKELENTVKELENGNVDLDVAIAKYTDAMKLAKLCNDKLKNAEDQVNKILASNGKLEDFELSE